MAGIEPIFTKLTIAKLHCVKIFVYQILPKYLKCVKSIYVYT
jgi:hypothetical protein